MKVDKDYEINLTKLDSVRENLNGFWILAENLGGESILWIKFEKEEYSTFWETIPFTDEIQKTKTLPWESCPTFIELTKVMDTVQINLISMGGKTQHKLNYMTKTKFIIDSSAYLRHKGYDFLN